MGGGGISADFGEKSTVINESIQDKQDMINMLHQGWTRQNPACKFFRV